MTPHHSIICSRPSISDLMVGGRRQRHNHFDSLLRRSSVPCEHRRRQSLGRVGHRRLKRSSGSSKEQIASLSAVWWLSHSFLPRDFPPGVPATRWISSAHIRSSFACTVIWVSRLADYSPNHPGSDVRRARPLPLTSSFKADVSPHGGDLTTASLRRCARSTGSVTVVS